MDCIGLPVPLVQMARAIVALCLLAGVIGVLAANPKIEHVVVLMMENRSFDHMLGFLKSNNTEVDGLTGAEFNYVNATDPTSKKVYANPYAVYVDPDPGHSVDATTEQVFGGLPPQDPAPMSGFVQNAYKLYGDQGECVMAAFTPLTTPVIHTLANEFAVFDKWFASVPGPTQVNRLYAISATSYGECINENYPQIIVGYPQKTIFEALDEAGLSWAVYFNDLPATLYSRYVRSHLDRFHWFPTFEKQAKEGTLPTFSWVEPRYFDDFGQPAADQHPSHDVSEGERFMKRVYEAVRNSPKWNSTLLIITYDEHGGFYDHVPPPMKGVPNPDGRNCTKPPFDFTRLGVRIPTIAISPWINKRTVVHDPVGPTPTSKYDHTSTLATVKKLFNLPNFLTARDAWAGTFEHLLQQRDTPRTDCPTTLPEPPKLRRVPLDGKQKLSNLQKDFLKLMRLITNTEGPDPASATEGEASRYIIETMAKYIGKPAPKVKYN